jgi:hypothetical protein
MRFVKGALDTLAHQAVELGMLEAVECIEVEREREEIPDELFLRTLVVLPFVEALGGSRQRTRSLRQMEAG